MELTFDEFLQIVENANNSEESPETIQEANDIIYQLQEKNTTLFLTLSAQIVLLENVTDAQATKGIQYIKSVLRQSRYYGIDYINQVWNSIPEDQRMQLKQALIRGIMFPVDELRNSASATLAIIAQLEYPAQWPDFFDVLITICQDPECGSTSVMGVLQTLGDAFTSSTFIRPRFTKERDAALKVVCTLAFQVLQQDVEPVMKSAAVYMLINSFKTTFFRNFIRNPDLLSTTFQNLIDNFEVEDEDLHYFIYDFFLITFKKMYDKIFSEHIEDIAQAVTRDLQSGIPEFQKIALSFIKKCANYEAELPKDKVNSESNFSINCSQNFSESIIPFLAYLEDTYYIEESDESLSYFTYRALKSLACFDADNLLQLVQEYFTACKDDADWKTRCSSVIALRTIIGIKRNEFEEFVWSIFPDLVNLTQDQSDVVRIHSQKFIASFIKTYSLMDDDGKEVQFIVDIFTELLQEDEQQAISGCHIIINFIKRYSENDIQSPLGDPDIFNSILKTLWAQFERPEITNPTISVKVKQAICFLCRKSPFSTMEDRKAFCIEILDKFRENANTLQNSPNASHELITIQSILLDIFGQVIFSIRGLLINGEENEQFIDEVFEYLSQFLPKMEELPNLVKTIGNLIITAPSHSENFAETLVKFLMDAQTSRNVTLIAESSMTMGDLFRAATGIMQEYSDPFCSLLLDNIEDDNLSDTSVCQSIMTLADVVRFSRPENIIDYRDRMMTVIRNYTHYRYNPDDKGDVETMTNFFEGIIYLSGAILKTFAEDVEFITDKKNMDILFEFRLHIDPNIFKSSSLDYSVILFLDCALDHKKAARSYNIFLNHHNIKEYLQKIINRSKNKECIKKAKELRPRLINA